MTAEERDGVLTLLRDAMEERTAAPPAQPAWPRTQHPYRSIDKIQTASMTAALTGARTPANV